MFVVVLALDKSGATQALASLLTKGNPLVTFGTSSFLFANLVNNIPMSVFYSAVTACVPDGQIAPALYSAAAGSNLGAYFTPIGALAGIMFSTILRSHGHSFGYREFLRLGVTVALPSLLAALFGLFLVLG